MKNKYLKIILIATLLITLVGLTSATEVSDDTISTDNDSEIVQEAPTTTDTIQSSVAEQSKHVQKEEKRIKRTSKTYDVDDFDTLHNALTSNQFDTVTLNINSNIDLSGNTTLNNVITQLTINGNGKTMNGNDTTHFLEIKENSTVTIKDIEFRNCRSKNSWLGGGVIHNGGSLIISNSSFNNNYADIGGVIYNHGNLVITKCAFNNNDANRTGGAIFSSNNTNITDSILNNNTAQQGGAIYSKCNLTIINCTLNNNKVNNTGGAVYNYQKYLNITDSTLNNNTASKGGAIYNSNSDLTIDNTTLNYNYANSGGAIYNDYGNITITDSTLNNNNASNGGAIYLFFKKLNIYNTTLNNNNANTGGAINNYHCNINITDSTLNNNNAKNDGGAISNSDNLTITNSIINDNTASNGGAIYTSKKLDIYNTTLNNNNVNNTGGAIRNNIGNLTITNCTLNNNYADFSAGGLFNHAGNITINNSIFNNNTGNGTGWINSGGAIRNNGNLTINNSIFSNNKADYDGGAICNGDGYKLVILNCSLYNNTAPITGGAIKNFGNLTINNTILNNNTVDYDGGAIYNGPFKNKFTYLTINNCTLNNNIAKDNGGAIYNDYANLTINNSVINNNTAKNYGGAIRSNSNLTINNTILNNNKVNRDGGAIYNDGGYELVILNCSLYNNTAVNTGGAIKNLGNLTVNNTIFVNNTAKSDGGAIDNEYANLTINNSLLNNNTSNYYGGAITNDGNLTVNNTILDNNNADSGGGAIYNHVKRKLVISNCSLCNNTTPDSGGAIKNLGNLTINNTILNTNKADYGGGAIYNYYANITINNSMLNNNTAKRDGGAINDFYVNSTINNSTLNNNNAKRDGGAIWGYQNSNLTITDSTLNYNKADCGGGAIYNQGNAMIKNNTFKMNEANMTGPAIIDNNQTAQITDNLYDEVSAYSGTIYTSGQNVNITHNTFDDGIMYTTITINTNNTQPIVNEKIKITYTLKELSNKTIADKTITTTIDEVSYNLTTNSDGIATLTYTPTITGTCKITATYEGNTEYNRTTTSLNITINKINTTINLNDIPDAEYSDIITISGSLTASTGEVIGNATIKLKFNSVNYNTKTDADGNFALNYTVKTVGTNNVTATFNGNSLYNSVSTSGTFTAVKKDTVITLDDIPSADYSDRITISGTFTRSTGVPLKNATIKLTINGKNYNTKTDANGVYAINYTVTKIGVNNVTATFNGNSVYNSVNTTKTFTANKKDTIITINDIPDTEYSDKIAVSGEFTRNTGVALANATITLVINGVNYNTKTDANGYYTVNYTVTKVGTNNVTAKFNGNSVYNSVNASMTFTVVKKDTVITLDDISGFEYYELRRISGRFTRDTGVPIANATITLIVNNEEYKRKTGADGNFSMQYVVNHVGENKLTVLFDGNSVYKSVNTTVTFIVGKKDTMITISDIPDVEYSDVVQFNVGLMRDTGSMIGEAPLTVIINDVRYNIKTDYWNGIYTMGLTAKKIGVNNVTVIFAGNKVYHPSNITTTFIVDKKDTAITINDIPDAQYSDTVTITGRFTRDTGAALPNAPISVTVNDEEYMVKTNASGYYLLNYTTTQLGTNTVTASFNGNSVYNSVTSTKTFTVTD